jgi:FkbM family methyltransferase
MRYKVSKTCQIPNLDQIYYKYFGELHKGYFVEIGAFDGETVSNTSCLSDCGWKGIYVEPVLEHYVKCLNRHLKNDIVVVNVAVGLEEGIQDIYCSGLLTTLDKNQSEMTSRMKVFNYPEFTKSVCYQMKLETLLKKYNVSKNFDLLVVDVEGKEREVLESFSLNEWRPKMMIIELVDYHDEFKNNFQTAVEESKKIRSYIQGNNYSEIYRDHINTIFIDNEYITSNSNL